MRPIQLSSGHMVPYDSVKLENQMEKKSTTWAKVSGKDVEDVLLVRLLTSESVAIDGFKGEDSTYTVTFSEPFPGIPATTKLHRKDMTKEVFLVVRESNKRAADAAI